MLQAFRAVYRAANRADVNRSERNDDEQWMHPDMVSDVCGKIDDILISLTACGVMSNDERQRFYDNL